MNKGHLLKLLAPFPDDVEIVIGNPLPGPGLGIKRIVSIGYHFPVGETPRLVISSEHLGDLSNQQVKTVLQ